MKKERTKMVLLGLAVFAIVAVTSWMITKYLDWTRVQKAADSYITQIVSDMEQRVKELGVTDFRVEVYKLERQTFADEAEKAIKEADEDNLVDVENIYKEKNHSQYYHFDFYSNKIADLFANAEQLEEKEELFEKMRRVRGVISNYLGYVSYHEKYISSSGVPFSVFMKGPVSMSRFQIVTETGDIYSIYADSTHQQLNINNQLYYDDMPASEEEKVELPVKPADPKPNPTPVDPKPNNDSDRYGDSFETWDPYDREEYDNGDDFADEWAEEFGEGNYEDGYDDAYDYWENGY